MAEKRGSQVLGLIQGKYPVHGVISKAGPFETLILLSSKWGFELVSRNFHHLFDLGGHLNAHFSCSSKGNNIAKLVKGACRVQLNCNVH